MYIDRVTITGADDNDNPEELKMLSEQYPFVEWGLLFSRGKKGTARYPSSERIADFLSSGVRLSAHFCGWYSREVLENKNYSLLTALKNFHRVQINYNFSLSNNWDLQPLLEWFFGHPSLSVIFQVNKANADVIDRLHNVDFPENIHFLYDSSGGRGTVIQRIEPVFVNYTGYSGGIGPDNVEAVLRKIIDYPNPAKVWIDMESGVRTGDRLDLKKVEAVLAKCDFLMKNPFGAAL